MLLILITISPLLWAIRFSKNFIVQIYILSLMYVAIKIQIGVNSSALLIAAFVFLSNIFTLCFSIIFPGKLWRAKIKTSKNTFKVLSMAFFFGVLAIYLLAMGAGGFSNLTASWLIIKDELEGNDLYRASSMISYCLAVGFYLHWRLMIANKKPYLDIGLLFVLIVYAIAIKVKLFIVPPLLALFLVKNGASIGLIKIFKYSVLVVLVYLMVMTIRWVGDIENLNYEVFWETVNSVGDAGVERELFHQSTSVFNYYQIHEFNYGQSIRRIFMQLFSMLGVVSDVPANPMYKYYEISNNGISIDGASAHPSVYADSFAEWGWIGVIIPSLYLMILNWMSNKYSGKISDAISYSILFISMPLLVRGSTYYAYMYLLVSITLISYNELIRYGTVHKK